MSRIYSDSHRALQRRFDTERLADRIEERLVRARLTEDDRAFIAARDMLFLATADAAGRPNCSYKGGDPGFVRTPDATTLLMPCYDGNGMYLSMGNAAENPHVGLLFIDFEAGTRLRVNGRARLLSPGEADGPWPGAQLLMRVDVAEVFPNCPRYIHAMRQVGQSPYVPRPGEKAPVPAWKRAGWAADVLAATDPAREEPGGP